MLRQIAAFKEQLSNQMKNERDNSQEWMKDLRENFQGLRSIIEADRGQVRESI